METIRPKKNNVTHVIPADWDCKDLKDVLATSLQNGLFYEPSRKGKGVPLVNVSDLFMDYPIDSSSLELFNATEDECNRFKVQRGDIFFTRSSLVPSGIAHCNIFLDTKNERVVFDSHVIKASPNQKIISPEFFYRFLTSSTARKYFIANSKTATMTTIDQGVINKCPVLIPSKKEQEAIANALSDADAYIESLEKLIDKKRLNKKGVIHELLTGKRRLEGFKNTKKFKDTEIGLIPDDWSIKSISQIGEVGRGRVISHNEISKSYNPIYPVYSSQTSNHGIMGFIDTYDFDGEYITWTTDGANAGTVFHRTGRFNCTNVCGTIKTYNDDAKFIAFQLAIYSKSHVSRHLGNPKLMNDVMKKVIIPVPVDIHEQKIIANCIKDLESEITQIEFKLDKARLIKQGMMQELLTGRIRLV